MHYNRKIKVIYSKEDAEKLDGQSKICNWTYNRLIDACKEDYAAEEKDKKHLLRGRNLRNHMVKMKEENPFMRAVYGHVLQEAANRLKAAYEGFFNTGKGYPRYRSWSNKWFSLVYDEAAKQVKIDNDKLTIPLGKIVEEGAENKKARNIYITGTLTEDFFLKEGEKLKTCSITKEGDIFYAIFCIETAETKEEKEYKEQLAAYKTALVKYNSDKKKAKENGKIFNQEKPSRPAMLSPQIPNNVKWISLDPNHKNLFVGIDYLGNTVEFGNFEMIQYFDTLIDKLKSKRDKCIRSYRKHTTENGSTYTIHSPRYNRLNKAVKKNYKKRDEQIKKACYQTAHWLYSQYDLVIIGDYTPSLDTANQKTMHRSMLNQTVIGKLRKIIEWVAFKEEKYFIKQNEKDTTKKCCICGHMEKKDPSVREFTCPVCGKTIKRDVNSAVNIAGKAGYRPLSIENINRIMDYIQPAYNKELYCQRSGHLIIR